MSISAPETETPTNRLSPLPNLKVGFIVVAVGVLVSGVAHGYLDGRWSSHADLNAFGQGLETLPERCGDWTMSRRDELAPTAQRVLRCHGSVVREYVDEKTGRRVSVAVLFGPRGPIAVHTPEICYSSVGTEVAGPRVSEVLEVDGTNHSLWRTEFIHPPDPNPNFEVWYGWSAGGAWEARDYPRFWMTDNLFKIQLAGPPGDADSESACRDFLIAFLPELQQYIATL